jgi:hypothetical protein
MTRGRKRAERGPIIPGLSQGPEPPIDLDEGEAAKWRAIVAALPEDWFTADNVILLREYVRHAVYADFLARQIAVLRRQNSPLDGPSWKQLGQLLRAHGRQSSQLALLAVKLRLCPSARYRADYAAGR